MRRLVLVVALALAPSVVHAQRAHERFAAQDTVRGETRATWRPLRVSKWATLLASAGAAGYGFSQNRAADRDYEALERECAETPAACATTPGTDMYANAALEARYQRIVERDDNARLALLAGQVGVVASVVMFIMDLPKNSTPEDIPYEPKPLRVGLRSGRANLTYHLGTRF